MTHAERLARLRLIRTPHVGPVSWHQLMQRFGSGEAALDALPDLVLYQTCKAAIEGLTRSLARDLGPDNIRVSCVIPGNVKTPRQMQWYTPEGEQEIVDAQCLKGRILPADVAALTLFLASDDTAYVTGAKILVDGGVLAQQRSPQVDTLRPQDFPPVDSI